MIQEKVLNWDKKGERFPKEEIMDALYEQEKRRQGATITIFFNDIKY